MKLGNKMLLGSSLLAVLPVLVTGGVVSGLSTTLSESSLIDQTREQLTTIRELKREQVAEYFQLVRSEIQAESRSRQVILALRGFSENYDTYDVLPRTEWQEALREHYANDLVTELRRQGAETGVDLGQLAGELPAVAQSLQYHYIVDNESPYGFKDELNAAADGSAYSALHDRMHPVLRDIVRTGPGSSGHGDLLLVDGGSGNVVYSVGKNMDFATSLRDGPYARTALGRAFRRAMDAPSPNDVIVTDFERYQPAFGTAAAFVASPIVLGTERLGVLILRLSVDELNRIMASDEAWRRVGLGDSGETYLVGGDGTMRTDSRFLVERPDSYLQQLTEAGVLETTVRRIEEQNSSALLQPVDTQASRDAFAGRTGFLQSTDYREVPVFTSYAPFRMAGLNWAIVSQLDAAEALAPVTDLQISTLGWSAVVGLGILVLGGAAGWYFTRTVVRPVSHLEDTVRRLSEGDDSARARMNTGDEMQTLGDAFDSLLEERIAEHERTVRENERLNNAVIDLLKAVHELSQHDLTVRAPVTEDVTGPVADAINQMVTEVGTLLGDVRRVAEQVGGASQRLRQQADSVKSMATEEGEEVNRMANELSEAADAMNQIAEVAENCDRIAAMAAETTGTALETVNGTVSGMGTIRELVHETEKRIKRLGERSQEISGIVDIINSIAERTHVLALNASMQAAAAGEAGRGFAVVAEEVQRLAESSRDATSQISGLVNNIQIETADTISTMGRTIGEVVEGSRLAERAGEQMQNTRQTTDKLVAAVQEIARDSQRQATVSGELKVTAERVRESTAGTRLRLDEQTTQTQYLVAYARRLLEGIRVFKLPDQYTEEQHTEDEYRGEPPENQHAEDVPKGGEYPEGQYTEDEHKEDEETAPAASVQDARSGRS